MIYNYVVIVCYFFKQLGMYFSFLSFFSSFSLFIVLIFKYFHPLAFCSCNFCHIGITFQYQFYCLSLILLSFFHYVFPHYCHTIISFKKLFIRYNINYNEKLFPML